MIDLSQFDEREKDSVYHRDVLEMIHARLDEIFDLVVAELEKIGKDQMLPAGAVLTGGGSHMPHIVEFAKQKLRLPVSIGRPENLIGVVDHVDDASYATVVGLILWAVNGTQNTNTNPFGGGKFDAIGEVVGSSFAKIKETFQRFLP